MTELERIQRAKMYMEKLANGINPIDDTMAPEEDIINHVRLSRCFFFVAGVLQQVIENGGIRPAIAPKKSQKRPFELPLEERNRFSYSEDPVAASEIARRMNNLVNDENMRKFSYSEIIDWLVELEMMELIPRPDGKQTRRPTRTGEEIGISVEERIHNNNPYQVVVYNAAAQRFIVENLDSIIAAAKTRSELKGAPWERVHDDCLIDLYQKSVPISEIAVTLKRSTSAIRKKLKKLGLDSQ